MHHSQALRANFAKVIVSLIIAATAPFAHASDWSGGTASWGSNGNPGWNGTGVPNAAGAIANHSDTNSGTATQDQGTVTVGVISLTNNSANSFTILNSAGTIILNQDGAGTGSATISNTTSDTGTSSFLFVSLGTLSLADNLFISNTGGNTNVTGAIQISSTIVGTGNLVLSSASNTVTNSTTFPGAIRIQTGVNTFVGSTLVQKGAVTFNNANSFGPASNAITLGAAGQGSASLISTAGFTWNAWPITVASGAGDTLVLGSVSTGGVAIGGTITLNGDVTLRAASTGGNTENFTGKVTGAGNITVSGTTGGTGGVVTLSNNTNDFTGAVNVSTGVLLITQNNSLGATSGATSVTSGAQFRTNGNITTPEPITLNGTGSDVGGDGALRTNGGSNPIFTGLITLGSSGVLFFNNATAATQTTATISGGISGANTDMTFNALNAGNWVVNTNPIATGSGNLTKLGAGSLTLGVANTFSGTTRAGAGTIVLSDSLALQNSTLDMNGADTGTVAFGTTDATVGALTGSRALTTPNGVLSVGNNNSNTTYSGVLSGAGTLNKVGNGIMTLTSGNGYVGGTTINGGVLLASNSSGSATGTGAVAVKSGGTLGGTGSVSGAVTVEAGGTLAPGASIGTLASGDLTLTASNSTMSAEIDAAAPNADLLNVTGAISLNNSTLNLTITNSGAITSSQTYILIQNDSTDSVSGTFATITGLPTGFSAIVNTAFSGTDSLGRIGDGNDIAVEISVPEPGAVSLVLLGALLAIRRRGSIA